jgi:hypothetical protein
MLLQIMKILYHWHKATGFTLLIVIVWHLAQRDKQYEEWVCQTCALQCNNEKKKTCKCNANIYFNQQSIRNNVVRDYTKLNVPNTSPASKFTYKETQILKIKNEFRFLYIKKRSIDGKLHQVHLTLANKLGTICIVMEYLL